MSAITTLLIYLLRFLVVIIAIVLHRITVGKRGASLCSDKNITTTVFHFSPCAVFSNEYNKARSKFRNACKNHEKGELHTLPTVVVFKDDDYTIDICVLLADNNKNVVIHSSGTHGVEGYAGSAIQVAYLEGQQNITTTTIFIHAINPYGMAHYRRVNENNVDLNRNALEEFEQHVLSHRTGYETFSSLFNPSRRPSSLFDSIWFYYHALVQILVKHGGGGMIHLKRSMVAGQYHNERGIFYGGTELQPSLVLLRDFLQDKLLPLLLQQQNTSPSLLTWIDVHTGLGKSGDDTLLVSQPNNVSPQELLSIFPGSTIPGISKSGDSVKAGYELTVGMLDTFVLNILLKDHFKHPLFVTQEFGTIPMILVGKALILENMAYQYYSKEEDNDRRLQYSKSTLKPAFYVATPTWRRKILQNGLRVLQQAMERDSSEKIE